MGVKNCPETPRQKMINMMYLVLTALLALNVAAETLYAFKVVDISLVRTFESFSRKNANIMSDFDWQVEKGQRPKVAEKYRAEAIKVHNSSDSIISFISDLKEELVNLAGAEKLQPGESVPEEFPFVVTKNNDTLILKRQDDLNISSNVLIEKGKGEILKKQIMSFKERMKSIAESDSTLTKLLDSTFFQNLDKILDVSDPDKRDKTTDAKTWVQQNFDRTPLIASITMLSKTESDVRFAENTLITAIYSAIKGESYFEAKVIPKSTYILSGVQKFEADIFLSAITNVPRAEVYVNGNSNPIIMENGKAVFTASPSTPGKYPYSGEIQYRSPEGLLISAPFKGEYEVAPPSAVCSPLRMNVLYVDVDNPIGISAPSTSSNSLEPVINNGTITKSGNEWLVSPKDVGNARIDIFANIENKRVLLGSSEFRVLNVPTPQPCLYDFINGAKIPKSFFTGDGIKELGAKSPDFLFDLTYEVLGFDASIPKSGGASATFSSNSKDFPAELSRLLSQLPKGSYIRFDNVKARIKGKTKVRTINPAIFYIE